MPRLTYRQVVADIQRKPGLGSISQGEVWQAVLMAAKDINNQPWPWNYAETNILVPANYSTGTVSVVNGSATVTGNGTAWDPTWYGRRIRFGNNNLDYIVSSISGAGTLTLAQPVNLSASIVNGSYTLYQDTFLYPADYLFGSDVGLYQPDIQARIVKKPRYTFENLMNSGIRSFFTNVVQFYCDHGEDPTTGLFRFRLGPPASGPIELRLTYHSITPDPSAADVTPLAEGFDEILTLTASAKLYDLKKLPGDSMACRELAAGKIRLLKRQVATQTIDDTPNVAGEVSDSSISQGGLIITRMA